MVNASVGLLANGNRKKLMLNNRFCVLSVVHRIFKAATVFNDDILKMSELYNENHLESMNNIHQNTIHSITSKAHLGIHNNVHSHP
ncbi:hypothetical protein T4A_2923 [Trichinella pseudospiralis]|uniref:Uncharacterized protein n=1 Tax=Trichinella pseudospiralis TaxID=6337 RepID=A0A0V1EP53_TRIPS|nr:hypothetical protein T4A_2923 [Trichinella pseudospiralis]